MFKIDKSSVEYMDQNMSMFAVRNGGPEQTEKKDPAEPVQAAESYAKEIRLKAAEEVAAILAKANQQAEQMRQKAWQEGFAAGQADFCAQQEEQAGLLARIRQEIGAFKASLAGQLEEAVLQLSLDVAEKIVDKQLEKDDKLFQEIIQTALGQIKEKEKITVRLSQADFLQVSPDADQELKERSSCQDFSLVRDDALKTGDCLIEFSSGILNAGISSQLKLIAWALGQKD